MTKMTKKRVIAIILVVICLISLTPVSFASLGPMIKKSKKSEKVMSYSSLKMTIDELSKYKVSDFVSAKGYPIGNIDPRADKLGDQIPGSNWYSAGSMTSLLSYFFAADETALAPEQTAWKIFENYKDETSDRRLKNGKFKGIDKGKGSFKYGSLSLIDDAYANENIVESTTEEIIDSYVEEVEEADYDESMVESEESVYEDSSPTKATHSTTNTQVEGVDEADIVKTDGKYIYYLNKNKGVAIFSAGRNPRQVFTLTPKTPQKSERNYTDMFLSGDTLIISAESVIDKVAPYEEDRLEGVTSTIFYVYDLSSNYYQELVRTVELEGEMLTTRFFNNTIYFVTQTELFQANYGANVASFVPYYSDTAFGDSEYRFIMPENTYLWSGSKFGNMCILSSFNLDEKTPIKPNAYSGPIDTLYMNKESIYLSGTLSRQSVDDTGFEDHVSGRKFVAPNFGDKGQSSTYFYRFSIDEKDFKFQTMTSLPGELINRFAMDEYSKTFRTVLSNLVENNGQFYESFYGDRARVNELYILDQRDLSVLGKIDDIGNGESLKSVRFRGSIAYAVTFKITDPLFVIDLSKSKTPKILGELKIPGFSAYLHPYGKNYLIGVGREIDDYYGSDLGLKLSLFDVSDPANMKEVSKLILPGGGTVTNATSDPRAFMFDMQKGLVTFPIVYDSPKIIDGEDKNGFITDEISGYVVSTDKKWAGGIAIGFSKDGFEVKQKINLGEDETLEFGSRFVFINDLLYYIDEGNLVVMDYDTFETISKTKLVFKDAE